MLQGCRKLWGMQRKENRALQEGAENGQGESFFSWMSPQSLWQSMAEEIPGFWNPCIQTNTKLDLPTTHHSCLSF